MKLLDAETLIKIPVAPSIDISSSKGLVIAFSDASIALDVPSPSPVPINAFPPLSVIIFLTSAKSTLIKPDPTIMSEIPLTAFVKTLSAALKESAIPEICWTSFSRSLGITIIESTSFVKSFIPESAWVILLFASNSNGFVTIAIVRAPASLANFATTGEAPVPVPPPIPAVIKTISAP